MRALWLPLLVSAIAWADAGVMIPSTATNQQPDPKVLTLDEMSIRVVIDNGNAKVNVQQIFSNHTGGLIEGNYVFALPGRALISDFAVWDDVTRIPGVILERKRAEELYRDIRIQALDPGLLQMGERDADQAQRTSLFTARVAPIPAWGTKRVEIEYQERLEVAQGQAYFSIPLKPDVYRAQAAGKLTIDVSFKNAHAVTDFQITSKTFPMGVTASGLFDPARGPRPNFSGHFDGTNVNFTEDFALKYTLDARRDALEVLTYRDGGGHRVL